MVKTYSVAPLAKRTLNTRGCGPRKLVRETRDPRGKATLAARIVDGHKRSNAIVTAGGIRISGTLDRRLMTVKTHCSRDRRKFARFCSIHGIVYKVPHDNALGGQWGYQTAVEVVGPEAALAQLCEQDFIVDCSATLDVRPPRLTANTFRKDPY
jgi:hypothetical protein